MKPDEDRYIKTMVNIFMTALCCVIILAVVGALVWVWGIAW